MSFWHQLVELLFFGIVETVAKQMYDMFYAVFLAQAQLHVSTGGCYKLPDAVDDNAWRLMRRITSPIPIDLTTGHFSRATSRQPLCAIKSSGDIMDVACLLANLATSLHRFVEVCLKAESSLRQSSALRPEGPALP